MAAKSVMGRFVAEEALGSQREAVSRLRPVASQLGLVFGEKHRRHEDIQALRQSYKEAVELAGGVEWLAVAIGKPITYASKISEALNGIEGRHIQFEEWTPALLSCPAAMDRIFAALCDRTTPQREMPKPKRIATPEELLGALLDEAGEDGKAGAELLKRAAARIGTDVGAFRR